MAKKPGTSQVTSTQNDELHFGLDLHYDDSDEDYADSDPGDFSGSEYSFESDVTLEDLAGDGIDLPKSKEKAESLANGKTKPASVANGDTMALVPTEAAANDPYDVASDEEQDLLKGIKDEIRNMVREEMHSELQVYEHKVKAIEAGRLPSADEAAAKEESKYPDLDNMEPELREAYIKMRKLDRVLEKKMKKEKEVKRDRILLERRIREEIGSMQTNGKIQRDIKANTDKYLALALPPSHNQDDFAEEEEGVIVDEPPVTPLFQTQVNEQVLNERQRRGNDASAGSRQESASSSRTTESAGTVDGDGNRQRSWKHGRHRKKKDFIKRNKELAANANDMIAMTDDEKKRLQELLTDVDAIPEIPEEELEGLNFSEDNNPFQIALQPGEGFMPSDNELRSLTAIDQRLQSIMPAEDFRSIVSSVVSHAPQQRLFTRTGAICEVDFEAYGEKALMETKEDREVTAKLKEIEEQLVKFQNTEETQPETTGLSEEQLESLLDDCVRSMSALSLPQDTPDSVDSARTLESARAQLMVNPPRLSDDMLQKLLSEAHFPLSSHLMALQDDDSKSEHGGSDGTGAIRAETWKAIAEATLSEEEREDGDTPSLGDQSHGTYFPHRTKEPVVFPRPSVSDTVIHPTLSRKPPLHRYSSQSSEFDGRDSRVSLPEISSTPLINTMQGGAAGVSNNDPSLYYNGRSRVRNSSSLDMVYNDLSVESLHSRMSSGNQQAAGTPLEIEEVGDQEQATPTPTPHPPSSERSTSRRSLKAMFDSIDKDQKS